MPKGGTSTDLTPIVQRITQAVQYVVQGVTPATWMGPMQPLQPMAPADVAGRQFDYSVGINLDTRARKDLPISFDQLRWLASSWPVLRTIIENRKNQVEALEWQVVPDKYSKMAMDDPRITAATRFLERPAPGMNWAHWIRMLMEDLFVLDAVAVYRRQTRGGGLYALEPIDGATISLLVDESGRVPMEGIAYQQILKGIPAVDYTRDELYYRMRNPRTNSLYGFSPVEQIIITVNIALRRDVYNLDYYTEGNIPPAIAAVPKEWNPEHIKAFQTHWDNIMAGNLSQKRRMRFVPGDVKVQQLVESPMKDSFDEWLARIACYAFNVSPQPFVKDNNRATAETAKDTAEDEGLQPLKRWIKGFADDILDQEFGDGLEFKFVDASAADAMKVAQTDAIYVQHGIKTRDEVRDSQGLNRLGGDASKLMVSGSVVAIQTETNDVGEAVPEVEPNEGEETNQNPAGKPKAEGDGVEEEQTAKMEGTSAGTVKKLLQSLGFMGVPGLAAAVDVTAPALTPALEAAGAEAVKALRAHLGMVFKAAGDEETPEEAAEAIAAATELGVLVAVADKLAPVLTTTVTTAGGEVLVSTGLPVGRDVFDLVQTDAVEYVAARGAVLVSEITQSTRNAIRDIIRRGLAENLGTDTIAGLLQQDFAFSYGRAQLIAETEIGNANGAGRQVGLEAAKGLGLPVKKKWLAELGACEICVTNMKQGAIPVEKAFASGDMAPLAHPRCRCDMVGVFEEEDSTT